MKMTVETKQLFYYKLIMQFIYVIECLKNELPSNTLFKTHLLPKINLRVVSHFEKCYFIGHNFSWLW